MDFSNKDTQLVSFIQELAKKTQQKHQKNNNIQTDIIVMDFVKAFGKVPHKKLLSKLNHYGMNTTPWNE